MYNFETSREDIQRLVIITTKDETRESQNVPIYAVFYTTTYYSVSLLRTIILKLYVLIDYWLTDFYNGRSIVNNKSIITRLEKNIWKN